MRIAIIKNIPAPGSTEVFQRLAEHKECNTLIVYETESESNRLWDVSGDVDFKCRTLRSATIDLRPIVSDAFLHVPWRPLGALRAFAPDVVVAGGGGMYTSPTNVASVLGRRRNGWAWVPWWGSFDHGTPRLVRRALDPWVRWFVGQGDAWIAYGSRAADDLVRLGAQRARTVIAPNVSRTFTTSARVEEDTDTRPERVPRFLFVGQLLERKGVDLLLEAHKAVPDALLTIAGDGPLRPEVERAAAENSRVVYRGHVALDDLPQLYANADALVLPSRYEVWGLVVNEALQFGLPVIASAEVGAVTDLLPDGGPGRVVRAGSVSCLASAMREVGSWSPERKAQSVSAARETTDRWSARAAADAIVDACRMAVRYRADEARMGR